MKLNALLYLTALSIGVAAASGDVLAQSHLRDAVMERQKLMKSMLKAYFPLMAIHKGKSEDLQKATEAIATLRQGMQESLPLFIDGTAKGEVPGSRAKPEVWSMSAEFKAAADELISTSESLSDAAKSGDLQAFKVQFERMDAACRTCHDFKPSSGGAFRFGK